MGGGGEGVFRSISTQSCTEVRSGLGLQPGGSAPTGSRGETKSRRLETSPDVVDGQDVLRVSFSLSTVAWSQEDN